MQLRAFALTAVLAVYAAPVFAQGASTGFPIGEKSRLHAELAIGVAVDTNASRTDTNRNPQLSNDLDGKLLVRPGLSLDVPGSSVKLSLAAHGSIFQYFGLGEATRSNTFVGADATLNFSLGSKKSVVGFSLSNTFVRTPAFIDQPGSVAADEITLKQWHDNVTARITLRPGGGALAFDIGYMGRINLYDDIDQSMQHGGFLEARFKFLPKTAAVFHADFSTFNTITDASQSTDTQNAPNPSTPYNITLGLLGQVTAKISVDVAAGFGDTLTWQDDTFSNLAEGNRRTFIARAGGKYQFNERSFLGLHYTRGVEPIVLLDNYVSDEARLRLQVGIGGRLVLAAFGSYEHRGYRQTRQNGSTFSPGADLFTADARIAYWFFDFLSASVNYRFILQNASTEGAGAAVLLLEDYQRHQAFLNINLRY